MLSSLLILAICLIVSGAFVGWAWSKNLLSEFRMLGMLTAIWICLFMILFTLVTRLAI